MVRHGVCMLWHAMDILDNREIRSVDVVAQWEAVERWLAMHCKNNSDQDDNIKPSAARKAKTAKPTKPRRTASKDTPGLVGPRFPPVPSLAPTRKKKSEKIPPLCCGEGSERFMDRRFMQQMQQRLLEQHEQTLQKRIKERQAEEAQREQRQIISSRTQGPRFRTSAQRSARRSRTASRIHSTISPRIHQMKEKRSRECEVSSDDLDEAIVCYDPAPRPPDPRPRLALLLHACRAVIGLHNDIESLPPVRRAQEPEDKEREDASLLRLKYESPLITKLREVESVEEMYRLAELIVMSTKHH